MLYVYNSIPTPILPPCHYQDRLIKPLNRIIWNRLKTRNEQEAPIFPYPTSPKDPFFDPTNPKGTIFPLVQ
uniref:Uncharacterized protein n=1 Tax=Arundo donax TaxID=35708 RepID=A0A0A8Y641_ARUDO